MDSSDGSGLRAVAATTERQGRSADFAPAELMIKDIATLAPRNFAGKLAAFLVIDAPQRPLVPQGWLQRPARESTSSHRSRPRQGRDCPERANGRAPLMRDFVRRRGGVRQAWSLGARRDQARYLGRQVRPG